MRRLVITENDLGSVKQYVVETSAGVRAVGATLESALGKLDLTDGPNVIPDELVGLRRVFRSIRPTGGASQIHKGVQS